VRRHFRRRARSSLGTAGGPAYPGKVAEALPPDTTGADGPGPGPLEHEAAGDRIDVLSLAKYTIPVHALLPLPILAAPTGSLDGWLSFGLLAIHLGFPMLLGLTYPLWRGQGIALAMLLVFNHLTTFASGIAFVFAASALGL
jgi:hypothetical protein